MNPFHYTAALSFGFPFLIATNLSVAGLSPTPLSCPASLNCTVKKQSIHCPVPTGYSDFSVSGTELTQGSVQGAVTLKFHSAILPSLAIQRFNLLTCQYKNPSALVELALPANQYFTPQKPALWAFYNHCSKSAKECTFFPASTHGLKVSSPEINKDGNHPNTIVVSKNQDAFQGQISITNTSTMTINRITIASDNAIPLSGTESCSTLAPGADCTLHYQAKASKIGSGSFPITMFGSSEDRNTYFFNQFNFLVFHR